MTNAEMYKTVDERVDAFYKFCAKKPCKECRLFKYKKYDSVCKEECAFQWLTLEGRERLKPCPFCCGRADIIRTHQLTESYYYVSCSNKNCNIRPFTCALPSKENVVALWNERVEAKK